MTNILTLPLAHVLIESGRCTGGDTPEHVGRWIFIVTFVDDDGCRLVDYTGPDRAAADEAAVGWARDASCRIVDRSTEEPGR